MGMRGIYAKLAHAGRVYEDTVQALKSGWASDWKARGAYPIGWIWAEGDPIAEARQAFELCRDYRLSGLIVNAEDAYEGAGFGKSVRFAQEIRRLAPRLPLAVSTIGFGVPYRDFDYLAWVKAGAAIMSQCYDSSQVRSVTEAWRMLERALGTETARSLMVPTIGSSYNPRANIDEAVQTARSVGLRGLNLWMVQGGATPDDYIREVIGKAVAAGVVAA